MASVCVSFCCPKRSCGYARPITITSRVLEAHTALWEVIMLRTKHRTWRRVYIGVLHVYHTTRTQLHSGILGTAQRLASRIRWERNSVLINRSHFHCKTIHCHRRRTHHHPHRLRRCSNFRSCRRHRMCRCPPRCSHSPGTCGSMHGEGQGQRSRLLWWGMVGCGCARRYVGDIAQVHEDTIGASRATESYAAPTHTTHYYVP